MVRAHELVRGEMVASSRWAWAGEHSPDAQATWVSASSPTSASSLPFGTALVHHLIHLKHSVLRSCPWRGHVLGPGVKRYLRYRVPPVAQQVEDLAAAARVPAEVWVQWPGAVS